MLLGYKEWTWDESEVVDENEYSYENYENTSVHFVGSLSALLKVELDIAAKEMGIEINSIVQKPVGPLVDYHIKYLLNKQLVD